jgi:hypothetical protein
MLFQYRTFWLPKDIQNPDEYQDACRVDAARGIAAIADGVTSSLFSAGWARILTRAVVTDPPNVFDTGSLHPWLAQQRQTWSASIDPDSLAWYQKAKLRSGAFATLLWVELSPTGPSQSHAAGSILLRGYAIGDCCLFHVRDGRVLRVFPIEDSKLFDADPQVIGSVATRRERALQFHTLEDTCRIGDLLVLTSDALAVWALAQLEAGRSPFWESFWDLSDDAWRQKVFDLRAARQVRYDDSTLVLLRLEETVAVAGQAAEHGTWIHDVKKQLSSWLPSGKND